MMGKSVATSEITDQDKVLLGLGTAVAATATVVLGAMIRSFVIQELWGWYLVPLFGLPPLRLVFAFGLSLFTIYMIAPAVRQDKRTFAAGFMHGVIGAAVMLGFGWLGTLFI